MCHAKRGGPRTPSRTIDANLDCVFVENALGNATAHILLQGGIFVSVETKQSGSEKRSLPGGRGKTLQSLASKEPGPIFRRSRMHPLQLEILNKSGQVVSVMAFFQA